MLRHTYATFICKSLKSSLQLEVEYILLEEKTITINNNDHNVVRKAWKTVNLKIPEEKDNRTRKDKFTHALTVDLQ